MNLILFIHNDAEKKGVTLTNSIVNNFNEKQTRIIRTFNTFKSKLKQFKNFSEKEIIILFVDSKIRLKQLSSLLDLLEDKRIILILPDNSKSTLSDGYKFFPRYFTFMDDTYDDLCDVLNKMIEQEKINNKER